MAHPDALRQVDGGESRDHPVTATVDMSRETPRHARLHRIVVVGGGAGGLELATRLGDKLGKRNKAHVTLIETARTHFWKPHLHEIAAGSMDIGVYQTNYLAQSHWHHFRYRVGEMVGLDRARREVHVAPFIDEDGDRVTSRRVFGYDTLVIAVGASPTISARRASRSTRSRSRRRRRPSAFTAAWSTRASARMPSPRRCARNSCNVAIIGAGATGVELAAELHNTARDARLLRPRPHRPREGHPADPDRGRRPHPAGAAGATVERGGEAAREARGERADRPRGSPRCCRRASSSRPAR